LVADSLHKIARGRSSSGKISRVLSQRDLLANGVDTALLEHVSTIDWDNVVLYHQYILDRKFVRWRRRSMKGALGVQNYTNLPSTLYRLVH
jgi:hypothetical protein